MALLDEPGGEAKGPVMLPSSQDTITIPPRIRDWLLEHARFETRAYFALARAGIVKLGDLDGRPWSEIFYLKGVGVGTAANIVEQLAAAADWLLEPPITPAPPPTDMPRRPTVILDWLEGSMLSRYLTITLWYYAGRETFEGIGCELNVTRERVRQIVAKGWRTARILLGHVRPWSDLMLAAISMIDELTVVTDLGLYDHLARELGWDTPASTGDLRALSGLLALSREVVVIRRQELVALCRVEKDAWARIKWLEHASPSQAEEAMLMLSEPAADILRDDLIRLVDLGGRRRQHGTHTRLGSSSERRVEPRRGPFG